MFLYDHNLMPWNMSIVNGIVCTFIPDLYCIAGWATDTKYSWYSDSINAVLVDHISLCLRKVMGRYPMQVKFTTVVGTLGVKVWFLSKWSHNWWNMAFRPCHPCHFTSVKYRADELNAVNVWPRIFRFGPQNVTTVLGIKILCSVVHSSCRFINRTEASKGTFV